MSKTFRVVASILLIIGAAMANAANFAPGNEDFFNKLSSRIETWQKSATASDSDAIATASQQITDCPDKARWEENTATINVGGEEVRYMTRDLADGHYCIFLLKPFERALSKEEGILFTKALVLKTNDPPDAGAATRTSKTDVYGARKFAELIARSKTPGLGDRDGNDDTNFYIDCSDVPIRNLKDAHGTQMSGFLYNDNYIWTLVALPPGLCVFVEQPLSRGLRSDEASDFIESTHRNLGVSAQYIRDHSDGLDSAPAGLPENAPGLNEIDSVSAPNVSGPTEFHGSTFPYNSAALLLNENANAGAGSAVQIGPTVFLTAAHVVVGASGKISGIRLHPRYKIGGGATPGLMYDVRVDPQYKASYGSNDDRNAEHDLAFLEVHDPQVLTTGYPTDLAIRARRDTGWPTATASCAPINPPIDPFYSDANYTWYPNYPCNGQGALKEILGYPIMGNVSAHNPYLSSPVVLENWRMGNYRELWHPDCSSLIPPVVCQPTMYLNLSYARPGSSGSPLFGKGGAGNWMLLGIVGRQARALQGQLPADGVAAGHFDYNDEWFQRAKAPTVSSVTISSPTEGMAYDRQATITLTANAGSQSSQLRWTSDVDGLLGTGASVALQPGRLSIGDQTITATIGTGSSNVQQQTTQATTAVTYRTIHIVVTGSNSPSCGANPSVVQIPETQTTGAFDYSWNIPGYTSLDLRGSINGAPFGNPVVVGSSQSSGDNIPLNDVWTYQFSPHGQTAPVLCTFTVVGVLADPPVVSFTPPSGIVNVSPAQTSGPFSYSWLAPGYPSLDLVGNINGTGWTHFTTLPGPTGATSDNVPAGYTYAFRFYQPSHVNGDPILGEFSMYAQPTVPTTCSVTPSNGHTTGPFTFTWNAPASFASLDLWGKAGTAPWHFGLTIPRSGNSGDTVPSNTTYKYRFYPKDYYPHNWSMSDSDTHFLCQFTIQNP